MPSRPSPSPLDPALSAQPRDILRNEFLRQSRILDREAPARFVATALGYGISALFLPLPLIAFLATANLVGEIVSFLILRDIDRMMDNVWRYQVVIAATFLFESSFALAAGLIWHQDDPYAKAFAVGMIASAMMHVATVRAIHLPMGLSGAAAIWIIVLTSNGLFWTWRGEWLPLAITTLTALGALGYFVSALISSNRLHRETSAGWAEAIEANAAKTRFLAQMSHELRTPLNAILGMGHAELNRTPDPASRERLEILVEAASGLGVLLDDILDMSAVQEGRLPIRPEPLDPRTAIATTVALFRPQAEAAGLSLDLVLDDNLPAAGLADGRRLRQCLSNLLSNALKYTQQGGIRLTATMTPGSLLRIEVADTGQGVPPDLNFAIFEPFRRGPGTQSGTGLGLTISRALAQRMDGDLVVLPSDVGARFCLTLKLGPARREDLAQPADEPPDFLKDRSILVVDDIATNRLVAATYLRHLGAKVTEAESGETALAMVARARPAAILLDMNMPGLTGVETLNRLRDLCGSALHIPVIAMTADATEAHRRAYLAAGLDGYIAKPLTPDRLSHALLPHFSVPLGKTAPAAAQRNNEVG